MVALNNFFSLYDTSMVLVEQSQRPYRFGMTLLCVGALFNWLGVADSYSDPVPAIRYIGVGLIAAGAILICLAMCFWMKSVRPATVNIDSEAGMHVETIEGPDLSLEKPPDYATVVDVPPCYEDAIKLNPAALLPMQNYNAFIEKSVSITKDEPARVNITVDSATAPTDPKKGADKLDEATLSNNTLSRVLRKSIRGIRKQLTSSPPEGTSAEGPTTSSRSYNVITVIPSVKLPQLHKTTALSRSASDGVASQECMGDPPAYEETVTSQTCQKSDALTNTYISGAIGEGHPSSGTTSEDHLCEGAVSEDHPSSGAISDDHSSSGAISESHPCSGATISSVEESTRVLETGDLDRESFSEVPETGVISNKVNDIISNAQSEAQRRSSLSYVDSSRNR